MSSTRNTTVLIGILVVTMTLFLFAPAVYADSHTDDQATSVDDPSYQIVQGDQKIPVAPIEGQEPVEAFYDYRHPHVGDRDHPRWGRSFSSHGTRQYQQNDTSVLMLYEGPDGVSLVAVHDKYYEEKADGTDGGSVSWTLSGLPTDGEWAVIDDDYGWRTSNVTKDDIHQLGPDHRDGAAGNDGEPPEGVDARLSWVWLTGRSDGVAYRGLDGDVSITIDPAFNENSYQRYGDTRRPDQEPDQPDKGDRYNGTIDEWQVIVPSDNSEGFERISLDSLEEPVHIESVSEGDQEYDALNAGLSVPTETAVTETVTFNATNTTGEVAEYEWFVNGSQVESTDKPTTTHEFEKPGTANVTVNVVTADGQVDTESASIEVTPEAGSSEEIGEDTEEMPGFGLIAALIGLLVTISVAARRTTR